MINIREANRSDADFIIQSQVAMALETEELVLDPLTVKLGVAALFDDPAKGKYYVATQSDEVVGCLLTIPEWSDWRNGTVLWIHSVYVSKSARRLGVFRQMYAYLKQKTEADVKLRGLRLYVEKKNHSAQATYQSLGMSKEHYEMYEWLK